MHLSLSLSLFLSFPLFVLTPAEESSAKLMGSPILAVGPDVTSSLSKMIRLHDRSIPPGTHAQRNGPRGCYLCYRKKAWWVNDSPS